MEREEQYGPLIEGMPSDSDEDDSLKTKAELDLIEKKRLDAIRRYEKQKRLYYYAIAEFDSINTACIVYDELDGVAAGYCSESLDLRFVPEDTPDPSTKREFVSFTDHIPESYTPPMVEVGDVTMQHSKVKLSWDEDPPERKVLMKKLTPAQIRDLDLEAYLESDDNEEEAVDADQIRKALLGDEAVDNSQVSEEESSQEESVMGEMEMSFSRDVESIGKNVAKKLADASGKSSEDMTVWEKYLEKRKEARKAKKAARRDQIEHQRQERIATAKANAKAAKKSKEAEEDSSDEDEALFKQSNMDDMVQDSRLDKLFSDSRFAVDPTHPSYKKSSVINSIKRKNSRK
jgi:hypothetical protein